MPEIDASGLTENLTRKVGPLPLWGWGAVAVGGFVILRFVGGRGSSGGSTSTVSTAQDVSTPDLGNGGTGGDNTADSGPTLSDIQTELDAIQAEFGNSNPGAVKLPPWFKTWLQANKPKPKPSPNPNPHHTLKSYVVQAGDTWATIAAAHHMTLAQFWKANPTLAANHAHMQRGGGRTIKVYK
jgi:LysM repeat protein